MSFSRISLIMVFLVLALVSLSIKAGAESPNGVFSQGLNVANYDCLLVMQPAKSLSKNSTVLVNLEWQDKAGGLQLGITRSTVTLANVQGNKKVQLKQLPSGVTPGEDTQFTVLRRGELLGIMHGEKMLFLDEVTRGPGADAILTADKGWAVEESSVQRLDPVVFTDDFMRTEEDPGAWTVHSGNWMLQSTWDLIPHGNTNKFAFATYAQNPFAWLGSCPEGVPSAVCTTGESFWEDYTYSVSVCPADGGAVGVAFNLTDEKNGVFLRWSPVNDRSERGNRLVLYKVVDGKAVDQLATSQGGYVPGQWYRLTVVSTMEGIRVLIDNHERLKIPAQSLWRGGIGLYVEGQTAAIFDDVTLYGQQVNTDLLKEIHQNGRMENDPNGMAGWSNWRSDWRSIGIGGMSWMRRPVYGDRLWMTIRLTPTALASGELTLLLNGDGKNIVTGYRAILQQSGDPAQLTYRLLKDATELAVAQAPRLNPGEEYTVRFSRRGAQLTLEVDDDVVIEARDVEPLPGLSPGYGATGAMQTVKEVMVCGDSIDDYSFASAPVDWVAEGKWIPTIRWACSPNWSFLAGWGRGDTALFHKSRVRGDQSLTAFVGLKMEYPRERATYDYRYRDFAVSLCTDGVSPRSGYAGVFPYQETPAAPKMIVIMKEGKVVASQNLTDELIPSRGKNHRTWFELELSRNGDTVEFSVSWLIPNGNNARTINTSIKYVDPQPLEEGVPAIWSYNNGISVARARLSHAGPLLPADKPRVMLGQLWYPEWLNVNEPLTLDFSQQSWSTSTHSLALRSEVVSAPPGNEGAVAVQGMRVTLTPKVPVQPGLEETRDAREHWYRVTAGDGAVESAPFEINVQVYDPTLGRDDSHAIALYRFDEAAGNVVKDRSSVAPALDLTIYDDAERKTPSAYWLPTQGLTLDRSSKVISATAADKLLALNTTKAGSIEFWASSETLYPRAEVANWVSCMLSWDSQTDASGQFRNLTVGQYPSVLAFVPKTNAPFYTDNNALRRFNGAHLGLQHIVLAWKDAQISGYIDGKLIATVNLPGPLDKNIAGSFLILGNTAGLTNAFVGEMYLLAIHDAALTAEQVQRHYQAGPSAR